MKKTTPDYRAALVLAAAIARLDGAARRELRVSGKWLTAATRRMRPQALARLPQVFSF